MRIATIPRGRAALWVRALRSSERGSTLIGQLVALTIIGMTLMIFSAALFTGSKGVLTVRQEVSAHNLACQQMEAIKDDQLRDSRVEFLHDGVVRADGPRRASPARQDCGA